MQTWKNVFFVFSLVLSLSHCEDIQTKDETQSKDVIGNGVDVVTNKEEDISGQPDDKDGNPDQVDNAVTNKKEGIPGQPDNNDGNPDQVDNAVTNKKEGMPGQPISNKEEAIGDQKVQYQNETIEESLPKLPINANDNGNDNDETKKDKGVIKEFDNKEQTKQKQTKEEIVENKAKDVIEPSNKNVPGQKPETKLRSMVNEYGKNQTQNKASQEQSSTLRVNLLKKENNIKKTNVPNNVEEDKKFEALKKSLIESIMNKTSVLVIKLARKKLYSSDKEKARVLKIIKAKILKKVSPISERYQLWTDVVTKCVDAAFAKLRQIKRYSHNKKHRKNNIGFRRRNNDEPRLNKKDPALKSQRLMIGKTHHGQQRACDLLTQVACDKIKSLNVLPCVNGTEPVTMEKLCDGIYDCVDGSDEINCADKAITKLKQSEKMIEEAESSKFMSCFNNDESFLGRKQSYSLKKTISNQVGLISHCIDSPLVKTSLKGQTRDRLVLEQASNQIATVISSVSLALDGAICAELVTSDDDDEAVMKRVNDHEDNVLGFINDHSNHDEDWTFKSCKCSGSVCLHQPCHEYCKKICDHKHSLGRMQCRSFSGDSSISLNVICDGKIDCEDESDEKGCNEGNAFARFEGVSVFGRLGQTVQAKIYSKHYIPVRAKLFSLQTELTKLQKINSNQALNKKALRLTRNKVFKLLGSIYVSMLTRLKTFNETEDLFVFLKSLHDKLIGALKRSHTGNVRLVPTEDCSCRETVCNVPSCPPYCVKACSVEPSFTRLTCNGEPEKKVAIGNICDGTKDCPSGDDEKLCDKEMCRKHHFLLLQMKLDKEIDTGSHQNLLGEILKTWKKKAITMVKTAEIAVVANRENFKQIVNNILHDLVMAYSFTDDVRGNPRQLYNTFYIVSQQVIKVVNYCGTY